MAVYLFGWGCCLCMSSVSSWSPARATLLFHTLVAQRWSAAKTIVDRAGLQHVDCVCKVPAATCWGPTLGPHSLQACSRIWRKQRVIPFRQLSVPKALLVLSSTKCLTAIVSKQVWGAELQQVQ